jgi:hypothetical protein
VAAAALLIASAPAWAASTVTAPDGTVIAVWEERNRASYIHTPTSERWAIAYSVNDGSGIRSGTIAPTEDVAADTAPFVAWDERSGAAVVVWSRFDGVSRKIAYARYSGGSWTDFHYLTFGTHDDLSPRTGSAAGGSYLFYVSKGRLTYAPIDLSGGRLLAVPRPLPSGASPWAWDDDRILSESDGRGIQCGDTPVVTGATTKEKKKGATTSSGVYDPSDPSLLSDTPVVTGKPQKTTPHTASLWGVGSGGNGCRHVALVLGGAHSDKLTVIRFTEGVVEVIHQVDLPRPVPRGFGQGLADTEARSLCDQAAQ